MWGCTVALWWWWWWWCWGTCLSRVSLWGFHAQPDRGEGSCLVRGKEARRTFIVVWTLRTHLLLLLC